MLLKTYGGHADEVTDVAGSCDSSYIVSASLDKSIIYWDVSTGEKGIPFYTLPLISNPVQARQCVDCAAMPEVYAVYALTRTPP